MLETSEDMLEEPGFVSYAASDAWGTLSAYEQLTGQAADKQARLSYTVLGCCLFAVCLPAMLKFCGMSTGHVFSGQNMLLRGACWKPLKA